jgi:hypothetical protein
MSDMASMLAPPPGWTPPDSGNPVPQTVAAPLPTETTPPVTVSTTTPGQVDTVNAPQSTQMIQPTTPAAQDPEMVAGAAHQNWLGKLLSNADAEMSKFLGGDQTIHVTKHQDGSYDVTHEASTTGERWARIAQAVLGGAASGMAAGQGPGGPAKAAAAGIAQGLNQAPQALQMANQQADQMNKQQLAKANMALLNQKVTMGTLAMRQQGIAMTDADVARANNNAAYLLANPANRRLGEITDMSELPAFAAKNADLIKQHANGLIHTQTELGSDGKPHVGVYQVDQNWLNQKNDKPYTYSHLAAGQTLDDPMVLQQVTIPPGAHTNGELMATHESEDAKIADYKIKLAGVNAKGGTPKVPTSPQQAQAMANLESDPVRQAALQKSVPQMQQLELQQKAAGREPAAIPTGATGPGGFMGEQFGGGDPNSTFERNAQMLANGDQVLSQVRIMRGKGQPTQQDYVARADQIDRANGGTGYDPAQVGIEYKQANEAKRQAAINAIDRAIGRPGQPGQIDQLIGLSDKAHLSNAPLIGGLINSGQLNAGNVAGDKNAQNLLNSIEDTRATFSALIGNPLLGGGETDKKLERAKAMIGNFPTPDNLRSAKNDVLVPALQTQRDALTSGNRFLTRMYGSSRQLSPLEQRRQAAAPPAAVVPPAAAVAPAAAAPSTGFNWNAHPKVQ